MNSSTSPIKSKAAKFQPDYAVYEYKVVEDEFMKLNDLAKMGNDGWVFCHVFASNDKNQYLFYRKKQ